MTRITPAQLRDHIETDPEVSDAQLMVYITTANELVTELCEPVGYTEARLELIELWLAAHFYAVRDVRAASESAGPVSETKQFRLGLVLQVTMYGQQALALDTAGALAALSKATEEGKPRRVSVTWLGQECDT